MKEATATVIVTILLMGVVFLWVNWRGLTSEGYSMSQRELMEWARVE